MQALNKKIPETREIFDLLNSFSFTQITISVISATALQNFLQISGYSSGIFAAITSLIFLTAIYFYPRSGLIISLSIGFLSVTVTELGLLASVLMTSIILYLSLSKISEKFSLAIMGTLTHLGDASTTFLAVNRGGLTEVNPLINIAMNNFGASAVFGAKIILIAVIFYSYFRLPEKESKLMLKVIYVTGLYLFLSNGFLLI